MRPPGCSVEIGRQVEASAYFGPGSADTLKLSCGFYLSVDSRMLDVDSAHSTRFVNARFICIVLGN